MDRRRHIARTEASRARSGPSRLAVFDGSASALRSASSSATATAAPLAAAATAGLAPEIAAAMRDWSWQAIKLTLAMGLRGDGDTLNRTASDLNRNAEAARMACAQAGAGPARRR